MRALTAGFRRAAAALRLTQPAVSARIRALEDSLSVRLFERGRQGHGMALSAAGRALRPHAEQLLQAAAPSPPAGPAPPPPPGRAPPNAPAASTSSTPSPPPSLRVLNTP